MPQTMHCSRGSFPVAFLFSAPGAAEVQANCPAAGTTGGNLSTALLLLADVRPDIFPSVERTDYRITNAYAQPLARSLGDKRTEATRKEILAPDNLARVLNELEGCDVVVLCGVRPSWLLPFITNAQQVIEVSHLSNQGLAAKHNGEIAQKEPTSAKRRHARITSWANDALKKLRQV